MIKITPTLLSTEEMSRLWSALQARYRPTAAYVVSVVLIDALRGARAPRPVLSRGEVDPATLREAGIEAAAGVVPALPTLVSAQPPGGQPAAQAGDRVELRGHHLEGADREAVLYNPRFEIERAIDAVAGTDDGLLAFDLPADLPVGVYGVAARLQRPAETRLRTSNQIPLALAPRITTALPLSVARDADGVATIDLAVEPPVRPGQRTALILDEREIVAEPFGTPTAALRFRATGLPLNRPLLARLRVDGIDSAVVDRSASPPRFLNRRITIT